MHELHLLSLERIRSIEAEFDEDIHSVVSGVRDMRESYRFISDVLEIPYGTFLKWQKRFNWTDGKRVWKRGILPNSIDEKARKLGYENAKHLVSVLRHEGKSRMEIGELLGCHPKSLYRHTPLEAKYLVIKTEKQVEARRKHIQRVNETRREKKEDRRAGDSRKYELG